MAEERPFITVQHPSSRRWAFLEDDGVGAWLYITEPDQAVPVAGCFVYSSAEPVDAILATWDRASPPPLTREFASERAWQLGVDGAAIRLAWASSGRAAVVLIDDEPVAMLATESKQGWSKSVAKPGIYGVPWDDEQFEQLFAEHFVAG